MGAIHKLERWITRAPDSADSWEQERNALQSRMTATAAHIRSLDRIEQAVSNAWEQWIRLEEKGCRQRGKPVGGAAPAAQDRCMV